MLNEICFESLLMALGIYQLQKLASERFELSLCHSLAGGGEVGVNQLSLDVC